MRRLKGPTLPWAKISNIRAGENRPLRLEFFYNNNLYIYIYLHLCKICIHAYRTCKPVRGNDKQQESTGGTGWCLHPTWKGCIHLYRTYGTPSKMWLKITSLQKYQPDWGYFTEKLCNFLGSPFFILFQNPKTLFCHIQLSSAPSFQITHNNINNAWLVVWTPLKNISQLGLLFPIYGKI